jgi:hypothetical protein
MIISTFIVQASFTIISYDHQNMFIIQATGSTVVKHSSHNLMIGGSNTATSTGRDKAAKSVAHNNVKCVMLGNEITQRRMRGNQLPVSVARWQYWSQIFFETLI